jgi:DNA-binding NarL/FixJ family response regulator
MPPAHRDEGIVAGREIRSAHPQTGVLVLSHYLESSYAVRLLEDQPERCGYLLKERVSDVAVLVDALGRITDGECVVDPTIIRQLLREPRDAGPLDTLTVREREVLATYAPTDARTGGRSRFERGQQLPPSRCQVSELTR